MYKGRISWLQIAYGTILLVYGLMMLSNSLGIINILGSHINYSTPSILIIISIILLIGSSKGIGLRISIENGVLIVEKFSKRVEINLSSITYINYENDYKYITLHTLATKSKIYLELVDSSSFLTNLHDQLRKYHPGYGLDEELFLNVLLRRTFKDHQRLRLHSYLWIAFLATPITFISAIMLSHSLELLNVIRIIILLVLPIVIILFPEVNFANRLEKKYRSEKIIERERNIRYEKSVYNKYLLAGSIIVILLVCSYIIY